MLVAVFLFKQIMPQNPIQVVLYDKKGKFIQLFRTISEYRSLFFKEDIGKRPVFNNKIENTEYHVNGDFIAFKEKVGRKKAVLFYKIHNCSLCSENKEKKPVQIINYKNEVIAEFKNTKILFKLMPHLSETTIHNQLKKSKSVKTSSPLGFFIRFSS
jgi:hypothetical protein